MALESLGVAYFKANAMPSDMELARGALLIAANEGDLEAQHSLGSFYFFGIGGDRNESDAVKWFRKAAEQGHADAQHRMGSAYRSHLGFGVSPDNAEAVKWFRKATDQGHVQARYDLARQLLYGEGVTKDPSKAVNLWREIAEKGHPAAQSMLGRCYEKGEGVPKDIAESRRWMQMAADQNYPNAKEALTARPIKAFKTLGYITLYIALLVGLFLVGAMFLRGGVWLSERITPWLFTTSWVVLILAVLVLLPLCVSKETRGVGGIGLTFVSYVFGATLWFWSLLITYTLWGWVALIVGLVIAGVGVLPIALLATAIKGEWAVFGELLFLTAATFGTRGMGLYFVNRSTVDSGETDMLRQSAKAKGRALSSKETAEIVELHRQIEEAQRNLEAHEAKIAAFLKSKAPQEPTIEEFKLSPSAMAELSKRADAARARIKARIEHNRAAGLDDWETNPDDAGDMPPLLVSQSSPDVVSRDTDEMKTPVSLEPSIPAEIGILVAGIGGCLIHPFSPLSVALLVVCFVAWSKRKKKTIFGTIGFVLMWVAIGLNVIYLIRLGWAYLTIFLAH